MNTKLIGILFSVILSLFSSCSKDSLKKLDHYEKHKVYANASNKEYSVHLLYPSNYDQNTSYETLFLLDANDYFLEMVEVIKEQYSGKVILIGLDYNYFDERMIDFTYPKNPNIAGSGSANKYIKFLQDDLMPYLTNLGIKSSSSTLLGHSLGGYFATYLLFQQDQPNLFDNIIAASPSLWWSDAYILDLEELYHKNHTTLNANFFLSMGDLEGVLMNTHFKAFEQILEKRNYQKGSWKSVLYSGVSHRNSPIISFKDGLSFIF